VPARRFGSLGAEAADKPGWKVGRPERVRIAPSTLLLNKAADTQRFLSKVRQ
jgi:hypothetical protein